MITILSALMVVGLTVSDVVADYSQEPPAARFQRFAREIMGGDGCPDATRSSSSKITAIVSIQVDSHQAPARIFAYVDFKNIGSSPEGLDKRVLLSGSRVRTDYLWLFDEKSRRWLDYAGPHGRLRSRASSDYVLLNPGESRSVHHLDVTANYSLPEKFDGLVAKISFVSDWRPGVEARIESPCARPTFDR